MTLNFHQMLPLLHVISYFFINLINTYVLYKLFFIKIIVVESDEHRLGRWITNKTKTVFGMMPPPERAADRNLANEDGKLIFESLLKYC